MATVVVIGWGQVAMSAMRGAVGVDVAFIDEHMALATDGNIAVDLLSAERDFVRSVEEFDAAAAARRQKMRSTVNPRLRKRRSR